MTASFDIQVQAMFVDFQTTKKTQSVIQIQKSIDIARLAVEKSNDETKQIKLRALDLILAKKEEDKRAKNHGNLKKNKLEKVEVKVEVKKVEKKVEIEDPLEALKKLKETLKNNKEQEKKNKASEKLMRALEKSNEKLKELDARAAYFKEKVEQNKIKRESRPLTMFETLMNNFKTNLYIVSVEEVFDTDIKVIFSKMTIEEVSDVIPTPLQDENIFETSSVIIEEVFDLDVDEMD